MTNYLVNKKIKNKTKSRK